MSAIFGTSPGINLTVSTTQHEARSYCRTYILDTILSSHRGLSLRQRHLDAFQLRIL